MLAKDVKKNIMQESEQLHLRSDIWNPYSKRIVHLSTMGFD